MKEEFFCLVAGERGENKLTEAYSFSGLPEDFERLGGARNALLLTGEIPPARLDEKMTLTLDPVKKLITTRAVPPFPPLVPFGAGHRAPAGWTTELSYLDGELRFVKPGDGPVLPTLAMHTRFDIGTDAEIALSSFIERYGIENFELEDSDYLAAVNGIIVIGTGVKAGTPIKIAAIAEKDHPTILVFSATPEAFDSLGGAALLGPVFLGYPPDMFEALESSETRVALIAKTFGQTLAERRKADAELKVWEMKTATETNLNAYRALSLSLACGGWCY